MNKKVIKLQENYEDVWIYYLLLTTLVIFISSLKQYYFTINGIELTYGVFFLPLIFLVTSYINKMFDYKKAVAAIAISAVMSICFIAIINFALGKDLILSRQSGDFCGYVISQFLFLTVLQYLNKYKKLSITNMFINILLSLIVFYFFYTLINLKIITFNTYWIGYAYTVLIQGVICIPIAIIDYIIKRK